MSWLSSFLHPERGYKNAQGQLDKYYDEAKGYYNQGQGYQQPYNTQGQAQTGNLNEYINKLMHPETLQDEWSKGYKESETAKQMEGLANEHGLNTASSMGLMGSSPALQAIQAGTTGIVAQDRQKYLDDLMEKYKTGAGISQGIYNTGATTAGQMGQNATTMGTNATNMGVNSAGLKFGETNAPGQTFGTLGGTALKTLMQYLTGGYGSGGYGRGAWSTGGA